MAHFAKLDVDGVVLAVHSVSNDVITAGGSESEQAGINFLVSIHGHSDWKQTSYNGNFRKNYAGIGYRYDSHLDAFIPPKPFPSWLLNEDLCRWEPPVAMPEGNFLWNESTLSWVEEIR